MERRIKVVKFLAALYFVVAMKKFGSHNNDNYLGLLELLAKFDPFMAKYIKAHANKEKGHSSQNHL